MSGNKECNHNADAPCDPRKGYVKAGKMKAALRKPASKKMAK